MYLVSLTWGELLLIVVITAVFTNFLGFYFYRHTLYLRKKLEAQSAENTKITQLLKLSEQHIKTDEQRLEDYTVAVTELKKSLQQTSVSSQEYYAEKTGLEQALKVQNLRIVERDQQLLTQGKVLHQREQQLEGLNQQLYEVKKDFERIKVERDKDQQSALQKIQLLNESKEQLKQEFENLANRIFEHKQQHFAQSSQHTLDALLKPLKEQIDSFRQRVDHVHSETVKGQGMMQIELLKLRDLNSKITQEAHDLTRALKGDKKLQGNWGEQKLEYLLEQAGLRKGIEFEREVYYRDEQGDGKRPDFIIHLPINKHLVIDSKVSLVAYSDYVAAQMDQEKKSKALSAHIRAVRQHISSLSEKQYPQWKQGNSPDFVFLFMPIEPAYILVAEHDPAIFEWAYAQGIALVTASSLLPVLRVVANLWSIQRQNQSTQTLAIQAEKIYEKLRIFVDKMQKLGGQITSLQTSYQDTFKTLHEGKGSLTKLVGQFTELGIKVRGKLPSEVLGNGEGE